MRSWLSKVSQGYRHNYQFLICPKSLGIYVGKMMSYVIYIFPHAIVESPELWKSSPLKMTQSREDQLSHQPQKSQHNMCHHTASSTPPRTRTYWPKFFPSVSRSPLYAAAAILIFLTVTPHSSSLSSQPLR